MTAQKYRVIVCEPIVCGFCRVSFGSLGAYMAHAERCSARNAAHLTDLAPAGCNRPSGNAPAYA